MQEKDLSAALLPGDPSAATKTEALPNGTDDAPSEIVLREVCHCASLWENGVRLLGNVRATDIQRAAAEGAAAIRKLWGCELGRDLSAAYHDAVRKEFDLPDPSTNAIVDRLRAHREVLLELQRVFAFMTAEQRADLFPDWFEPRVDELLGSGTQSPDAERADATRRSEAT